MTAAEALKELNKTLQANAARPAATLPLMDRSGCNHPGSCTKCGKR